MDWKRSTLKFKTVKIYGDVLLGFLLICIIQISSAVTDPTDVAALNSLYASLGSPPLPGWVASGGDPCGEGWQGIQCNGSFIQKIVLNGANLGGELGDNLATFVTISVIDLSNNNIGGSIPSNLPVTMRNFFLSANLFTGSIPASLSTLSGMTDMSLNNNHLTGEIPDAFQSLTQLINLDLSSNNLSGELPPSVESLSSLTTLRLQDNQLSGTLDVLQDLPLKDLNVENNQFAGPIPPKLLNIPTFRQAGNPFNDNATEPSAPPPGSQVPPPPGAPVSGAPSSGTGVPSSGTGVPSSGSGVPSSGSGSGRVPTKQADGPTVATESKFGRSKKHTKRVVLISIASVLVFVIFVLALILFVPRCGRRERVDRRSRQRQIGAYGGERQNARDFEAVVVQPPIRTEKVPPTVDVLRPKDDHQEQPRRVWAVPNAQDKQEKDVQRMAAIPKSKDQEIDISTPEVYSMPLPPPPPPPPPPTPPPPPPPPHPLPTKRVIAEPTTSHRATNVNPSLRSSIIPPTFAKSFTIASLQQYTNSFSQENLIGGGMLGTVYRAELPDGKLLAVKKFDKRASNPHKDDEFLELVNNIDRIRHSNIVELIGYCSEHGQRLLIFEYCSNGSLYDALHSDEELKAALSWNTRIRIALGAARALEYLHEQCQPPVIHRNLKSANILLDEDRSVRLSDCGLAPLIASGSVSQLSGNLQSTYGYGAPEFELGTYNYQSDVYTFGVIMLELLTGRQSHDRARPRGEQFLARWAIPKLHDIDALSKMVDPSLNGVYPAKSLSNFADIISRCLLLEPEFRPAMSEVVLYLLNMMKRESEASDSNEK